MTKNSFSFIVYIIHACSYMWKKSPSEVYAKLQESGCINKYLVPHYDILHTQSSDLVVNDVEKYLEVRGIVI